MTELDAGAISMAGVTDANGNGWATQKCYYALIRVELSYPDRLTTSRVITQQNEGGQLRLLRDTIINGTKQK